MKEVGTIYTCDECGKKAVDERYDPVDPAGWVMVPTYTSHDRLTLKVDGVSINVILGGKCFCGTPCLTFHIGKTVADAVAQAKNEAAGEVELGGEETAT